MCFHYKNGELFVEDVAVKDIAAEAGTPFYCYSAEKITKNFQMGIAFRRRLHIIKI